MKSENKRALVAALRAKLASGQSDVDIQQDLQINEREYNELLALMYQLDADTRFKKPAEQAFIDYCLRQEGCVQDLNRLIRRCSRSRNFNAVVGAVRAKSDIIDRMIQRGQEFGVLKKVPEQQQIIAGVVVRDLDDAELRAQVVSRLELLRSMMSRFGHKDMLEARVPDKLVVAQPAQMSDGEKPGAGKATGGLAKAKGARAVNTISRVKQKHSPPK